MALSFRPRFFFQKLYITSRSFCDNKSIYQRNEDEEKSSKERKVHGEPYPDWRKPWIQREGEFKPKLGFFTEKNPSPDILNAMQGIPHLTVNKIKNWWADMKSLQEVENQKYIAERVEILGSNLAAAHFFTFRSASVRFKGQNHWLSGLTDEITLPNSYEDGIFVEAIDCTNFHKGGIRYEGLNNLMDLNFLKWLSLKNNKYVDIWCIDRIAGLTKSLEYLDISGCQLCSGCFIALARIPTLKMLVVTDPGDNMELQAGLSILEQNMSGLIVNAIKPTE